MRVNPERGESQASRMDTNPERREYQARGMERIS
jgi:hypothetical protein